MIYYGIFNKKLNVIEYSDLALQRHIRWNLELNKFYNTIIGTYEEGLYFIGIL